MDFFIKHKKLIIIAGFISVVLFLGYLLYALFFKPPAEPEKETAQPPGGVAAPGGGLPISPSGDGQVAAPTKPGQLPAVEKRPGEKRADPIAKGGVTETAELNKTSSLGATLSADGSKLQYYNKEDGKFYKIDKNGKIKLLSDKIFHSVDNVVWSPNKNKAILEYPDGANIIYDFSKEKQITLPTHWKDFNFSPNGDKIVMKSMGLDPDNRWLAVVNEDGSKARAIEALGQKDETVYSSWSPNNQTIAMYTEGIDFDRQEVYFIGMNDENFKSLVIEGRGFQPKWSPRGDRLLYSVYSSRNGMKPMLWITNAQGESIGSGRRSLGVETWADKCAFANNSDIYCAVPENLEEGAGLFPEMAKQTSDRLYLIDSRTGLKKLIAVPNGSYNMSNLIISDDGRNLYFTDSATGRLYKIRLK